MLPELRREQAQAMADLGFDGYAIGGLSVGEPKELMLAMVEATTPELPEDKPRYLMGVGTPGRPGGGGGPGGGHVRLRAAHAERPERHGLHRDRQGGDQKLRARLRRRAAGCGLRLLHLPPLLPGLSPASLYGQRNSGLSPFNFA